MAELLLLSGGLDSIALAAWRRPAICLTIDYGQIPAAAEINAASSACIALGLKHKVLTVPLKELGSGALAGKPPYSGSPHSEFWPFRNQLLITLAAIIAINHSASTVLIGTVASDVRHADGSKTFIHSLNGLLQMQEGQIALEAPAINYTSLDLFRAAHVDVSILAWAHSCHSSCIACGNCPGCNKHSSFMNSIGWNR